MKLYKFDKNRYDEIVSYVLAIVVAIPFMTNFLGSAFHYFGLSTTYSTYAIYLFVVIYEYYNLLRVSYYKFGKALLFQATAGACFLLNCYCIPESAVYFQANLMELALVVLIYIPIGVYLIDIGNMEIFMDKMELLAYLTPVLCLISYSVFDIASMMNYMVFSTMILPGTLMCCYHMMKARGRKKLVYMLLFLIDMYLLLSFGARSPFLAVIIYICFLYYRKQMHASAAKKIVTVAALLLCLLFLMFASDTLSDFLVSALSPYVSDSRIIETIVSGTFFESSEYGGRETIYGFAQEELSRMGMSIHGLFGDRLALSNHMATGSYKTNYVHNFYYEVLLSFGWILGGIIVIAVTLKAAKALLLRGKETKFHFVAYFFCLEFVRLLVSGSFLTEGLSVLFFCALFIKEKSSPKENAYDQ